MAGWPHKTLTCAAWGAVCVLLLAPIALARRSLNWSNSAGWHFEVYGSCAELWVPIGRQGRPGGFLPLGWSLENVRWPWRLLPDIRAPSDDGWLIITCPFWFMAMPIGVWLWWGQRRPSATGARCGSCGYSLAGLGTRGTTPRRCPECGGGCGRTTPTRTGWRDTTPPS